MRNVRIIAAVWLDRDDKTYFYGPFNTDGEWAMGMLYLRTLWADGIAAGNVGLYTHHLGDPPWLMESIGGWPPGHHMHQVEAFPMKCAERPVKGDPTCVHLAGHPGEHQTREQWENEE